MSRFHSFVLSLAWLASAAACAGEGEFDPTFGNHLPGRSVLAFAENDAPRALLVLPDGSLLAAGTSYQLYRGLLLRWSASGSPDSGFGSAGALTLQPPGATEFDIYDAVLHAADAVLVTGAARYGDDFDPVACRVFLDGLPDLGFGAGGCVRLELGPTYDEARSVVLDAQGRILLGGYRGPFMCAARLSADGTRDATFGTQGVALITRFHELDPQVGDSDAVKVLTDSRGIVLAGSVDGKDFAAARLDTDGALDPSFSQDGVTRIDFTPASPRNELARDAVLLPDGSLVIVGDSNAPVEFAVARLTPDGELDPGFSGDGWLRLAFDASPGSGAQAHAVLRQADGRLVVGGNSYVVGGDRNMAVVRLLADGTPDASFAQQSRFVGNFELRAPGSNREELYALAQQGDRPIAVGNALRADVAELDAALLRLTGTRAFADGFEPLP